MATLELKWTAPDSCSILCTRCGKGRHLQRDTYRYLPNLLKIKCSCGHVIPLELEQRCEVRTLVVLMDTLYAPVTQESLGHVTITDLSTHGVGFKCPSPDIQVGQRDTISFVLDEDAMTRFEEVIVMRHVQADHTAGAEFVAPERDTFVLDMYLMTRPMSSRQAVSSSSSPFPAPLEEPA